MLSKCKSIFDCKSQAETEFADGSTNAAYPHLIYLTSIELILRNVFFQRCGNLLHNRLLRLYWLLPKKLR